MAKITKRFVDALKPVTRDTLYRDSELKGFALRVKPSGARTYVVQYRNETGRTRKLALGRVGELTPDEARGMAKDALGAVRKGKDPSANRAAARNGLTVAELCDEYLMAAERGGALGKRGHPKTAFTILTDRGRIRAHIKPQLGALMVRAVTRQDVVDFRNAVQFGKTARKVKGKRPQGRTVAGGPGAASRTLGLLGGIFTYAVERGYRSDNPVRGVKRPADRRRIDFLSPEDYWRLGAALDAAERDGESTARIKAIRALALTGCRRGEIRGLRWAEVDLQARQLRLAQTKEGYSLRPLGQAAVKLFDGIDRHPKSDAVFAIGPAGEPMSELQRAWERIAKRAGFSSFTLHSLRHSFATTANTVGYSEATIAGLLGHSRGGATARYVHVVDAALLVAADRVASHIASYMAGERPATIHKIGDRQGTMSLFRDILGR